MLAPGPPATCAPPRELRPSRARLLLEMLCGLSVALAGGLLAEHASRAAFAFGIHPATALFPGVYGVIGGVWALKAACGLRRPPARLRLDDQGLRTLSLWPPPQRLAWAEVAEVRACRLPLAGQIVFVRRRAPPAGASRWRRLVGRAPLVIDARSLSLPSRMLIDLLDAQTLTHAFRG